MAFLLFILVNATLFIRPAEIVPALLGWEIYFYLIVACLVIAAPEVIRYLTGKPRHPTGDAMRVGRWSRYRFHLSSRVICRDVANGFRQSVHLYLLFVSIVTTPFVCALLFILCFCASVTLLVVSPYRHYSTRNGAALDDTMRGQCNATITFKRLQGTASFRSERIVRLARRHAADSRSTLFASRNVFTRLGTIPLFGYAVFSPSRGGFGVRAGSALG